ncbi:MAG: choline kinase family protein [bacterium]
MNNIDVKKLIEKEINKKVEVINRFSGGMSNYTYLIKVNEQLFTFRIPGKNSEVFINREIEKENLDLITKLNLNCENVYINTLNGYKMSKYIEGEDLTNSKVDYYTVVEKLKQLHNSGIKAVNEYNKKERLDYYESLVSYKHNENYFELKNKMFKILEDYNNIELVFCHGDAQKANWLQSDSLYLLDWEYSGLNDPYYDIACFGNVNFEDAIILLKHYLNKEPNNIEMNRLILNRMFQCLQWHNVAIYKEEIGLSKDLNIDFKKVSEKYIVLAKELYEKIKM